MTTESHRNQHDIEAEEAYWDEVHAKQDEADQAERDRYYGGHQEIEADDTDSDREANGGTTNQERIAASHEANDPDSHFSEN